LNFLIISKSIPFSRKPYGMCALGPPPPRPRPRVSPQLLAEALADLLRNAVVKPVQSNLRALKLHENAFAVSRLASCVRRDKAISAAVLQGANAPKTVSPT
jgi:hypothetical protein